MIFNTLTHICTQAQVVLCCCVRAFRFFFLFLFRFSAFVVADSVFTLLTLYTATTDASFYPFCLWFCGHFHMLCHSMECRGNYGGKKSLWTKYWRSVVWFLSETSVHALFMWRIKNKIKITITYIVYCSTSVGFKRPKWNCKKWHYVLPESQ